MKRRPLALFMPCKMAEPGNCLSFNHQPATCNRLLTGLLLVFILLAGCTVASSTPASFEPTSQKVPPLPIPTFPPAGRALSDDEIATLSSLEQLDDFPLFTMRFVGAYPSPFLTAVEGLPTVESARPVALSMFQPRWGCSLFAALGDPNDRLYGRNFDWRFSPALLLFTDPPDAYASVSIVDIDYLGFGGDQADNPLDLPLDQRRALLDAPALPFDGMNEQGLAIGMAAVPPGEMRPDPDKKTTDQLGIMREILDHASTVDEAVDILGSYNIDMGSVPVHYLIATAAGDSALVEFYQGEMVVFRNEDPWHLATNFLVASANGQLQGQCPRYDRISRRLQETDGQLSIQDALDLLAGVSQGGPQAQSFTQWSVVYDMTSGDVHIVMGRKYTGEVHTLHLPRGEAAVGTP